MNTITTKEYEDQLRAMGYIPDLVEPLLRYGMWVAKGSHWKQVRTLLGRGIPEKEELAAFLALIKPIRVWTTGEDGNLANAFRQAGLNYVHLMPPSAMRTHPSNNAQLELDITDYELVGRWLEAARPDVVVHAAAIPGSERVSAHQTEAQEVDYEASKNLFTMCNSMLIPVIFLSSTCIYDIEASRPYTETSPINPATMYGSLKYTAEITLQNVCTDTKWMILRPCFTYGGKADRLSQLARFVRGTRYGEETIDISLDPDNQKDWMRIEGLVSAVDIAIRALLFHPAPPTVFNVSLGEPHKTLTYFRMLDDILHTSSWYPPTPNINWIPEMDYLGNHVVDSTLLKYWGWYPAYNGEKGRFNGLKKLIADVFTGPELTTDFTALRG